MDNRKLLALSQQLQSKSAAEVDDALHRLRLDATERVAIKVQLQASAPGRTVRAGYGLATDTAVSQRQESRPLNENEMDRTLRRLGIDGRHTYREADLTELLMQAGVEPEQRISVKIECGRRGLIRATHATDPDEATRLVRNLGVTGPVTLEWLEREMDARGYMPSIKSVIVSECRAKGWLKGGGNRTLRASSPVLTGRDGTPVTLRSLPE